MADAGPDIIADTDETIILDGSVSYDPDGTIVYCEWESMPPLKDLLCFGPELICETKAFGFVEDVIRLTVTDNHGATATDTMKIINRKVQDLRDDVDRILSYPMFRFGYHPLGLYHPYIYGPEGKSGESEQPNKE